ncbi:MAG: hypothetical protein U0169_11510 [Polyangiaceae bacterium]
MVRFVLPTSLVVLATLVTTGCNTYSDAVGRSRKAYEQHQHERALGILRSIERDTSRLGTEERAQYAYLRGMTDYRIGYKLDARHWLGVARAIEKDKPGSLSSDWNARLEETLQELDQIVHEKGIENVPNTPRHDDDAPASKKAKSDEAT